MAQRRRKQREWVAAPLRGLLFIAYGVPILWILLTSFKSQRDVFDKGWGIILFRPVPDAYLDNFNSGLATAVTQSFIIAASTTALVLVVAVPAAYALARISGIVTTIGLGVLIVLQMVPQTSIVIPLFQIYGAAGLLDQTIAVVLADSALLTPFAILLLRPFFRGVPRAVEEAGALDGASVPRIFWSLALPIARNGLATTGTLVFLISWGEFLYAVNFFLSPQHYPVSALLSQQVTAFGINWPGLMALAVLTSIPILVLFLSTYRLLKDGLTVGAVK